MRISKWKLWWWAQLPFLPSWVRNKRNLKIIKLYARKQRKERLKNAAIIANRQKESKEAINKLRQITIAQNTENKP